MFTRLFRHFAKSRRPKPIQRPEKRPRRRLYLEQLEDRIVPSAALMTDQFDYTPGSTAVISGSGFQPGETIQLNVVGTNGTNSSRTLTDGADGNFTANWYVDPSNVNSTLTATATGLSSGLTAKATFMDDNNSFSGSIYTTTSTGTKVNANIFDLKTDVYLNGGPQNTNSAGLPDGIYFFQVTTPNWSPAQSDLTKGLLSSDAAVYRELQVVNGVVAGAYPDTDSTSPHQNGTYNSTNRPSSR